MSLKKRTIIPIFLYLTIIGLNFMNCTESDVFKNLDGYLFIRYPDKNRQFLIYDLSDNKKYNFTQLSNKQIKGFNLKVYRKNIYILKKSEFDGKDTILYEIDMLQQKVLRIITIKDFDHNQYHIVGSKIYLTDGFKIISYNMDHDQIKVLYETDEYIGTFAYFPDFNSFIIEKISNLGKRQVEPEYLILKYDLDSKATEEIDVGEGVCYSVKFNKIIYNDRKSEKIKIYDLNKKTFNITNTPAYWMNPNYTFITENIAVLHLRRFTFRNIIHLKGAEDTQYILYDTKTGRTKHLVEDSIATWSLKVQYIEKNKLSIDELLKAGVLTEAK